MNDQISSKILAKKPNLPVVIQGGAYRADLGPNKTQLKTFKFALSAFKTLIEEGGSEYRQRDAVKLACIVNDLGMAPRNRPKRVHNFSLPSEYLGMLERAKINSGEVLIFWESTLRNGAEQDRERRGIKIQKTEGGSPRCVSIMGRFYEILARLGFRSQIGFYEAKTEIPPPDYKGAIDRACIYGPIEAALGFSGYELKIEVLNALVKLNEDAHVVEWHQSKPDAP
ncbi:hypothetical protein HYT84_04540 [Candidatus Micrarchaeota archaeon]|nr:hypothetical protein [Candidatus Micrarchaeota archaeon]